MKLKDLQDAMIAAMKAKDKPRKDSISALVSAVKKAGIDAGCRDDIPEDMVNQVVLKELKSVKEQIDTCPADRTDLKEEYQARYDIIAKYAPKQMDEAEIKEVVASVLAEMGLDAPTAKDKGKIMKNLMPKVKGKADGKLVNEIVSTFMK